MIAAFQKATAIDVSQEGNVFLNSCTAALCFSEGDLVYSESIDLMNDLRKVLYSSIDLSSTGDQEDPSIPPITNLVSSLSSKPRNSSPCYVAGVSLMPDACGRIPR